MFDKDKSRTKGKVESSIQDYYDGIGERPDGLGDEEFTPTDYAYSPDAKNYIDAKYGLNDDGAADEELPKPASTESAEPDDSDEFNGAEYEKNGHASPEDLSEWEKTHPISPLRDASPHVPQPDDIEPDQPALTGRQMDFEDLEEQPPENYDSTLPEEKVQDAASKIDSEDVEGSGETVPWSYVVGLIETAGYKVPSPTSPNFQLIISRYDDLLHFGKNIDFNS